jgi:DNA-binding PadR family transcriptional regulator
VSERDPRLSHQALRVLGIFLDRPNEALAGADIWNETRLLSGTLYPILVRFEKAGWLTSKWEEVDSAQVGRPRRRLYRLTGVGYNKAQQALRELGFSGGRPAWKS